MTAAAKPRARLHTDGSVTVVDGFANFLSGLGAGNPKTLANTYSMALNYSAEQLDAAYRTSTWLGKIIDIPADDSTRNWRLWQAEDEDITDIEGTEARLGVRQKVRQALIWSRLYGGAVIIPGGLPGQPGQPVNLDRIGRDGVKFLTVLSRHDGVQPHGLIRDPLSEFYGQPEYWAINSAGGVEVRLHPSRVILVNGRKAHSSRGGNEIWGDSIWMHLQDSVTEADAGAAVIGALMQEAKIDVIKQPDLMSGMSTAEFEATLLRRYQMAAMLKSVANVLLLDKEDDWDQKQITWTGIPDVMMMLLTIMAGAADIPVTRLLGTSAKGLNATGEGDLRNYYDNVKAKQELILSPALAPLDEMLIRSSLGSRPDDVWYQWRSLWQPTDKEKAETAKAKADATKIYAESNLVPIDALAKGVQNQLIEDGVYPGLETAIDEAGAALDVPEIEEPDEDNSGVAET